MCAMVWPTPSKIVLSASEALCPSSSDTLRLIDTKFGTGVQCNKVFQNCEKFRGVQKLGGQNFDFSEKCVNQ